MDKFYIKSYEEVLKILMEIELFCVLIAEFVVFMSKIQFSFNSASYLVKTLESESGIQ